MPQTRWSTIWSIFRPHRPCLRQLGRRTACAGRRPACRPGGAAKHEHVLDVGTGTGLVAHLVAASVSPGMVIGIDLSDHMMSIARVSKSKNSQFLGMAAEHLVFRPQTFDLVTMGESLAYFADPNTSAGRSESGPAAWRPPGGVLPAAQLEHSRPGPLLPGPGATRPAALPEPASLQLRAMRSSASRTCCRSCSAPQASTSRG